MSAVAMMQTHGERDSMPTRRRTTAYETNKQDSDYQELLLAKMTELGQKVEESLVLSRANGEGIRLLRKELGVDDQHGRIPQIEQWILRVEQRVGKLEVCIEGLVADRNFQRGKVYVVTALIALVASSGGVAFFEFALKGRFH